MSARTPEVRDEVHAVYQQVTAEIDRRHPRCDASGRCCHFDAYGHRLYVTTAELATFISDFSEHPRPAALVEEPRRPGALTVLSPKSSDRGSCPLLISNRCSVHTIRPFGCRMYYCDPTAEDWMQATYARFHALLKELHVRRSLSYHYVEWRAALEQLDGLWNAGPVFPTPGASTL